MIARARGKARFSRITGGSQTEGSDWVRRMLEQPTEVERCSSCAPAAGLYLVRVDYD